MPSKWRKPSSRRTGGDGARTANPTPRISKNRRTPSSRVQRGGVDDRDTSHIEHNVAPSGAMTASAAANAPALAKSRSPTTVTTVLAPSRERTHKTRSHTVTPAQVTATAAIGPTPIPRRAPPMRHRSLEQRTTHSHKAIRPVIGRYARNSQRQYQDSSSHVNDPNDLPLHSNAQKECSGVFKDPGARLHRTHTLGVTRPRTAGSARCARPIPHPLLIVPPFTDNVDDIWSRGVPGTGGS